MPGPAMGDLALAGSESLRTSLSALLTQDPTFPWRSHGWETGRGCLQRGLLGSGLSLLVGVSGLGLLGVTMLGTHLLWARSSLGSHQPRLQPGASVDRRDAM